MGDRRLLRNCTQASRGFVVLLCAGLWWQPASAVTQSCDKDVVPSSCPASWPFLPAGYRDCRFSVALCPSQPAVNPLYQHLDQQGFTVQSWPQVQRAASQTVIITCGA